MFHSPWETLPSKKGEPGITGQTELKDEQQEKEVAKN